MKSIFRGISKAVSVIPTLILPFLLLNMYAYFMPQETAKSWFEQVVWSTILPSGKVIELNIETLLVLSGLFLLLIEIYKSTHVNNVQIFEHTLSFFLFLFYLKQLLFVPRFASNASLILCSMAAFDFIAGIAITITAARKDSVTTIKAAGLIPD